MANSATINSLAQSVRRRMNLVNLNTVGDAELKEYIRDALSAFHEMQLSRWRDYFVSLRRLTLTPGVEAYPLPDNFRAMIAVYATGLPNQTGTYRQQLTQFNMNQFGAMSTGGGAYVSQPFPAMYRVMGNSVYFSPIPAGTSGISGGVELWYAPQWSPPANDDDTISQVMPTGWELWCIFEACISVAARMRLAEFFQMYQALQAKAEQRIVSAMAIRDETAPVMTNQFDASRSLNVFGGL